MGAYGNSNPKVVERMWDEYVLADAGGPLPRYRG